MNISEIFLSFLSEQGLLPAQITRFFRKYPDFKPDIHWIGGLLYDQDAFNPVFVNMSNESSEFEEILKSKPFASDIMLSNWLKSISKILEYLKDEEYFKNAPVPQEQIKFGVTTIIQTCPLVDQSSKDSYIQKILGLINGNVQTLNTIATQPRTKRSEFESFLRAQGKSPATISIYSSAINQISKKYCPTLWSIQDSATLKVETDQLQQNKDYCEENVNRHNSLSAALKQYDIFLTNGPAVSYSTTTPIKTSRTSQDVRTGATTKYENNLVAFCLSYDSGRLYPGLNQTKALFEASEALKINYYTLKNMKDCFDRYNSCTTRKGWDIPLTDVRKQILDEYMVENGKEYKDNPDPTVIERAFEKARNILKMAQV